MSVREVTLIPTNLLNLKTKDLSDKEVIILYQMWANPFTDCAGVANINKMMIAAACRCDENELNQCLDKLEKRGFITQSGDLVFVNEWFEVHTFNSALQKKTLAGRIEKIKDDKIRKLVIEKSARVFESKSK